MAFIKEESEDIKIEEAFKVKQEDTEERIGWFPFSRLLMWTGMLTSHNQPNTHYYMPYQLVSTDDGF